MLKGLGNKMLMLFTVLEMRKKLIGYHQTEKIIAMQVASCDPVFVKIKEVGWFTVTLDVLDADEETWLATEVVAIKDVFSINESSIQRARIRLMFENSSPAELEALKAGLMVGDYDCDEDEEDDNDEDEYV